MSIKMKRTQSNANLNEMITRNAQVTGRNMDGVMRKWAPQMKAISEAFGGDIDDYKLLSTSILLENTANFLENQAKMRGLNEATQPLIQAA